MWEIKHGAKELIHERGAFARETTKVRGRQTGRPKVFSDEQVGVARRMRESEESIGTDRQNARYLANHPSAECSQTDH